MLNATHRGIHRSIHSSLLGMPGMGAGVTYLFRDDFTTADAAPLGTPRTCEPGPGSWTVVETDSGQLAVSGGFLVVDTNTATSGATGELGIVDPGRARVSGRVFKTRVTITDITSANAYFGLHPAATLQTPDRGAFYFDDDGFVLRFGNSFLNLGDGSGSGLLSVNDVVEVAIVQRGSAGNFYFIKSSDAGFSSWTLVYAETTDSQTPMYLMWDSLGTNQQKVDYIRIPDTTWVPTPLVSDSIDRADDSDDNLGTSDAAGHPEANGGSGVALTDYSFSGMSVDIVSNELACTGTNGDSPRYVAGYDCGQSDVVVEATVTTSSSFGYPGILLRLETTSGDNDCFCVMIGDSSNTVDIFEYAGRTQTNRDSAAFTVAANTSYRVVAIAEGTTITGVAGDSAVVSYGSATANQTETIHGFRGTRSGATPDRGDDIVIWSRTPSTPLDSY